MIRREPDWIRAIGAVTLAAVLASGRLSAQTNGYSFSDPAAAQIGLARAGGAPAASCTSLRRLGGFDFTIASASMRPAAGLAGAGDVPESCQVSGVIAPEINFIVNLPSRWNGRLYLHGNGGYAGEPVEAYGVTVRQGALKLGFATAFTDTGHDAAAQPEATWALNSRQKEIDYSFRAVHLTTVAAKEIIRAYYGAPPAYAYFEGCSTGGGQGLKAALRFPEDFDGIAIGAPVFNFVGLQLYGWAAQMAVEKTPLSAEKVARLGEAVLTRCDGGDGLADGVLDDPRRCDFEAARDLSACPGASACFTAAEIDAISRIYRGVVVDGKRIAPGAPLGAETAGQIIDGEGRRSPDASGWATRMFSTAGPRGPRQQSANVITWLKYLAFEKDDPDYDWTRLDVRRDLPKLGYMARIMDVNETDLRAFQARGGKILMYHGWADTGVNPLMTADYYDRAVADMGPDTAAFFRLFMVPGMFHCRGGVNVDRFDAITPVIRWVEQGRPPDRLIASRLEERGITRTRPLCRYPEVARLRDGGHPDRAEDFVCVAPSP